MFAPSLPQLRTQFKDIDAALSSFAMTVYVLGFGVGSLVAAPLSELYGRTIVYRVCVTLFLKLTIVCGLSTSLEMLVAIRFFAGCFGGPPVTIGGAIMSDLFAPGSRGKAMSWYQSGPVWAPLLGPVIGGFIAQAKGWRWVFWIIACPVGFLM